MTEAWKLFRGLVVGFGSAGSRHLRILRELGLEDLAVCDPRAESRNRAETDFGVKQTFPSLDQALAMKPTVVFVCSPTAEHVDQAIAAMEAGADVFIEKPLSTSLESIDRLAAARERLGKVVMVGHCFRFHQGLRTAKAWLDKGRIGRLLAVRASVGEYIPDVMPNYRNMYISEYSGVYELMHDIDLALWYAGQRPVRVFGIEGRVSDVGMRSPDLVEILIEFEDRLVASVHLDFFQRARRRQTELLGTNGTIIVEFAKWDECHVSLYDAGARTWRHERMPTVRDDMFRDEDRTFLEAVANRSPVSIDEHEGRRAIEVMAAAQESARTRAAVELAKSAGTGAGSAQ